MTRDELIALAKEAGIVTAHNTEHLTIAGIERFANLVAAKEREECAKVCDERAMKNEQIAEKAMIEEPDEVSYLRSAAWQISICAAAIRAMKP